MMDGLTIMRESMTEDSYHVITDEFPPRCALHLTFDEMLGYVARVMMPQNSDGSISKHYGSPLFLECPPNEPKGKT